MAIAKMKKFTILTFEERQATLLKELQKFEDVHFRKLSPGDAPELNLSEDVSVEAIDRYESELEKIKLAMTKIEPYVVKPKGLAALTTPPVMLAYDEFDKFVDTYDYEAVFRAVQLETAEITACRSEITKLKSENENLKLWTGLDVSPAEFDSLKLVKCVVGTVGKLSAEDFKNSILGTYSSVYIESIGEVKDETLLLTIIPEEIFEEVYGELKTLGFSRTVPGFKGLPNEAEAENNRRIDELTSRQDRASGKIAALVGEYDKLKIVHDYYQTALEREHARSGFLKTDTAVVMDGWVPEDNFEAFKAILAKTCGEDYYMEAEDVEKDSEEVPIKLKNGKFVTAFEGLTETFSMPKYNDIDPTPLFTPFYFIYFGFMLGDAGYGIILILATWAALKFCHFKAGMRRFIKFFFYLGFSTIFAGIIYGSAFGQTVFTPLTAPSGAKKAILDSQLDVVTMMLLAVGIGVLQMLFGLAIKAYVLARNGDILAAIFDAGFWFIAVASGLGYLIGMFGILPQAVYTVCMWLFYASLLGLAATQGRANEKLAVKAVSGIYSVYGITSYIGDLVSYTRIAALALSGAYISFAFNIMAGLFPAGPLRIVLGTVVYLLGLVLNLGLSALGAYVHTLRLQYVEFFGKFYEGGGVPFNPFRLKNSYIDVKK